jgi:hypothetical protein
MHIRQMAKDGKTVRELATIFGVHETTMRELLIEMGFSLDARFKNGKKGRVLFAGRANHNR